MGPVAVISPSPPLPLSQSGRDQGGGSDEIGGIEYDSRRVKAGDLFVAIRGRRADGTPFDGHEYVRSAVDRGAYAVLLERDMEVSATRIVAPDSRKAMARLASRFYGDPAEQLKIVGITGTNGKTTVSYLIRALFERAGLRTGLIGTLGYLVGTERLDAPFTTPESVELHRTLLEMARAGQEAVMMEVSSHALALDRVYGVPFAGAVFTNLTRDHLDFHRTQEAYFSAKARLFEELDAHTWAVINADDPAGRTLIERTRASVLTYGLSDEAEVHPTAQRLTARGIDMTVDTPDGAFDLSLKLRGRFNVYNALAAVATGVACGMDRAVIREGVGSVSGVPGRFEAVDAGQDFLVLVDYAHTPDALERVLSAARELTEGRLIVVFGCGGDRDRGKRPEMGAVSDKLADFSVVTSDNPRTEDPAAILRDIEAGLGDLKRVDAEDLDGNERAYAVLVDRRAAVRCAIGLARPDDTVVLAGKGHEDYQIVGHEKLPFDDREEALRALASRARSEPT
ncbi:MAG: UDP-N-acetylmuramoyl-L-alanyl-D-glutamate--2,6-diaminopimelate ligase [Candidatus Latescibacteria bacterium]|nr:UDP-N-acetylmuramoyl-L-alanyl-D-glutamate--2,6-diaminopimelate ligase [Candidatus Latescibacterota bacterium]